MDQVVQAVCWVLRNRAGDVDWAAFGAHDWDALVVTGHDQGVLPLLAHALDAAGWPAQMPSVVRYQIMAARYLHAAQAALFYEELARITQALTLVAPVVVLKGAALGPTVYAEPGLRPLSDIDVLVPKHALQAVCAALRSLGYVAAAQPQLAPHNDAVDHHVLFRGGPGQRVTLEVHWRLIGGAADWRSPDQQWLWQHTECCPSSVVPQQGVGDGVTHNDMLHLTPTAHVLYLAAHLMLQHGGAQARLIWFYDLHMLITQRELDWELLVQQAQTFRWEAALRGALRGAQQFFNTPVPAHVLEQVDTVADPHAAAFVRQKALAKPRSMRAMWLDLQTLRWPARVWWLLHAICPSPMYMRWRYRHWFAIRWLWMFAYPYRWLWAVKHGLRWLAERHPQRTVVTD